VARHDFGLTGAGEPVDVFRYYFEALRKLKEIKFKTVSSMQRHYVMQELYMALFDINQDNTKLSGNSLDLIRMNNKEGHWKGGPFQRMANDFAVNKIGDLFKISLIDYGEMPRYQARRLLDLARATGQGSASANEGLLRLLRSNAANGDENSRKVLDDLKKL